MPESRLTKLKHVALLTEYRHNRETLWYSSGGTRINFGDAKSDRFIIIHANLNTLLIYIIKYVAGYGVRL